MGRKRNGQPFLPKNKERRDKMRKEELIRQLKSIKAPEPNEKDSLQAKERLIKKVRTSFPKIIQERRMIIMKRRVLALAVVTSIVVVALILSTVLPARRVTSAKQIAKDVIAKEMHVTVDDEDMIVEGNIVIVTVNGKEVTVDTKEAKIMKISMPEPASLTEEERNRAIEIFRNSPEVKNFPIPVMTAPPENGDEGNKNGGFIITDEDEAIEKEKYVDLSNATIVSVKGYTFPNGKEKYASIEVQSDLLPKGYSATFFVDLKKGKIVSGGMGPSGSVKPGFIKKP